MYQVFESSFDENCYCYYPVINIEKAEDWTVFSAHLGSAIMMSC